MGGNRPEGLKLYNFTDNHDVERIYTKLNNKKHFVPAHILMYTLPGIPSIYYGSELGIEGKKERHSDDSLRPALNLDDYADALETNTCAKVIAALGKIRQNTPALSYGDYKELRLTTGQYAFARNYNGQSVVITVNNSDNDFEMTLPAGNANEYIGGLSGIRVPVVNGNITVNVKANSGEIWLPAESCSTEIKPVEMEVDVKVETEVVAEDEVKNIVEATALVENDVVKTEPDKAKVAVEDDIIVENTVSKTETPKTEETDDKLLEDIEEATENVEDTDKKANAAPASEPITLTKEASSKPKTYEEMTVEELQQAILDRMSQNGPLTDQMKRDVKENVYHNSLVNWIKSFR